MSYTVRVERLDGRPYYDEATLEGIMPERTQIYQGIARIWEVTGTSSISIGESDVDIQSTQISLPWNTPLLQKNDEIQVLSATTDSVMVGKRFQVQSSAKAGELRATRRYNVIGVS